MKILDAYNTENIDTQTSIKIEAQRILNSRVQNLDVIGHVYSVYRLINRKI